MSFLNVYPEEQELKNKKQKKEREEKKEEMKRKIKGQFL